MTRCDPVAEMNARPLLHVDEDDLRAQVPHNIAITFSGARMMYNLSHPRPMQAYSLDGNWNWAARDLNGARFPLG